MHQPVSQRSLLTKCESTEPGYSWFYSFEARTTDQNITFGTSASF